MEVHVIAYVLNEQIEHTLDELAAFVAYNEIKSGVAISKSNLLYFDLLNNALFENMLMNFSTLFDRAKNSSDDNCSFKQLQISCKALSEQKYKSVIDEIDLLHSESEIALPKTIRNKLLAHKDSKKIFDLTISPIDLITVKNTLLHGHNIVSNTFEQNIGASIKQYDFEYVKNGYKQSLLSLLNNK